MAMAYLLQSVIINAQGNPVTIRTIRASAVAAAITAGTVGSLTWNAVTNTTALSNLNLNAITFANRIFVAVGEGCHQHRWMNWTRVERLRIYMELLVVTQLHFQD